jgi:hypothetical protein
MTQLQVGSEREGIISFVVDRDATFLLGSMSGQCKSLRGVRVFSDLLQEDPHWVQPLWFPFGRQCRTHRGHYPLFFPCSMEV